MAGLNLGVFARMKANILTAVREDLEGTGDLSDQRIPVDTSTAKDSRAITVDGSTVTLSYGSDSDSNPKTGQPSNSYIESLHEDMVAQHPHGQAQFLRSAADERRAGMLERIAKGAKV